ncbi:Armadillo [Artemisia annua]|uniref:Armadillo n=1 Tax=Artemisia annua TaxID=35608 RepID=A0A2U1PRW8_ARTAN|nr:Armadillo [Artemisia annua]
MAFQTPISDPSSLVLLFFRYTDSSTGKYMHNFISPPILVGVKKYMQFFLSFSWTKQHGSVLTELRILAKHFLCGSLKADMRFCQSRIVKQVSMILNPTGSISLYQFSGYRKGFVGSKCVVNSTSSIIVLSLDFVCFCTFRDRRMGVASHFLLGKIIKALLADVEYQGEQVSSKVQEVVENMKNYIAQVKRTDFHSKVFSSFSWTKQHGVSVNELRIWPNTSYVVSSRQICGSAQVGLSIKLARLMSICLVVRVVLEETPLPSSSSRRVWSSDFTLSVYKIISYKVSHKCRSVNKNNHTSLVVTHHQEPTTRVSDGSHKLLASCRRKIIETMKCGGKMSRHQKTGKSLKSLVAKNPKMEEVKTSVSECKLHESSPKLKEIVKKLQSGGEGALQGLKEVRELAKEDSEARTSFASLGAISPLVVMLDSKDLDSQISALYALLNLGIGNDRNKAAIVEAGVVHKMLDLIESPSEGSPDQNLSAAIVANFLGLSALDSNKLIIGSSGAILFLIKCLIKTNNSLVIQDSLRALYYLSILPPNVSPMVEIDEFVQFLLSKIGDMKNISDLG